MTNRPYWSSIWPEKLTRDKKKVLANQGFEYDYSGDAFVHRTRRRVISFDAVSDMKVEELDVFTAGLDVSTKASFRFREGLAEGRLEQLMERYGWA